MIRLQQASEAFLHQHPAFASLKDRIDSGRNILRKTLVAAFRVVMRQELTQGVFHLPLIEEDQPRSAFFLDRADESFRKSIHVRRSRHQEFPRHPNTRRYTPS
jgi:hypothetical protein